MFARDTRGKQGNSESGRVHTILVKCTGTYDTTVRTSSDNGIGIMDRIAAGLLRRSLLFYV